MEASGSTPLAGKVVAVAGAAGNLGPTVVERLVQAGAHVCMCGRHADELQELAAKVGGNTSYDVVDLRDADATRRWAADLVEREGRVDGVAHLVGGWRGGMPIEESPAEDWAFLHDLLVTTVRNVTQAFTPHLLESGGRFVIVSSAQAQSPTSKNAAYAAAKAAAEAWVLALADRFRGSGATANIVVVGSIVTREMRAENPEKDFSTFTPAEEIAEAIAYLSSDAAASMNGQRLILRGAR
jgi:NAD(P)-dependent dehydrogenase (short-subunit alcohol dehydrogenase family)